MGPDDMQPIKYDERTTKEVLTNAIISAESDDQKSLFENIRKLKVQKMKDGDQNGYQYLTENFQDPRDFPFIFKKIMV